MWKEPTNNRPRPDRPAAFSPFKLEFYTCNQGSRKGTAIAQA